MSGKRFELRYLPLFRSDLAEIVGYIALQLHNPSAADALSMLWRKPFGRG